MLNGAPFFKRDKLYIFMYLPSDIIPLVVNQSKPRCILCCFSPSLPDHDFILFLWLYSLLRLGPLFIQLRLKHVFSASYGGDTLLCWLVAHCRWLQVGALSGQCPVKPHRDCGLCGKSLSGELLMEWKHCQMLLAYYSWSILACRPCCQLRACYLGCVMPQSGNKDGGGGVTGRDAKKKKSQFVWWGRERADKLERVTEITWTL